MSESVTNADILRLNRWVRATWLGWLLGVPIVAALALLGEAVGIGGAQALVGAGMGAGVGLLQARTLRAVLPRPFSWFWSSAIGLAIPFLATDIARITDLTSAYSLYVAVAAGGVITGLWQSWLLRSRVQNVGRWLVASTTGWTLAGLAAAGADWIVRAQRIRGVAGALLWFGLVASGGLVLGLVTGATLIRLRRAPAALKT